MAGLDLASYASNLGVFEGEKYGKRMAFPRGNPEERLSYKHMIPYDNDNDGKNINELRWKSIHEFESMGGHLPETIVVQSSNTMSFCGM